MNKKPCRECGQDAVVIHDDRLHLCSPCWIDKFVEKGRNSDRQSDRKVFTANRAGLRSSQSEPNGCVDAY